MAPAEAESAHFWASALPVAVMQASPPNPAVHAAQRRSAGFGSSPLAQPHPRRPCMSVDPGSGRSGGGVIVLAVIAAYLRTWRLVQYHHDHRAAFDGLQRMLDHHLGGAIGLHQM